MNPKNPKLIPFQGHIAPTSTEISAGPKESVKDLLREHIANAASIKKMTAEVTMKTNRQQRICEALSRQVRDTQVIRLGKFHYLVEAARIGSVPVNIRQVTVS